MKRDQAIGAEFERSFAKRIGARLQPGSGNQWYARGDLLGKGFIWSLKATKYNSFRVTTDMLSEVINVAEGPGGVGGDVIPGFSVCVDGEVFVILRADDFIGLIKEEAKALPPTKLDQKLANTSVPKLLRAKGVEEE